MNETELALLKQINDEYNQNFQKFMEIIFRRNLTFLNQTKLRLLAIIN
jgi:hypothetical protein